MLEQQGDDQTQVQRCKFTPGRPSTFLNVCNFFDSTHSKRTRVSSKQAPTGRLKREAATIRKLRRILPSFYLCYTAQKAESAVKNVNEEQGATDELKTTNHNLKLINLNLNETIMPQQPRRRPLSTVATHE